MSANSARAVPASTGITTTPAARHASQNGKTAGAVADRQHHETVRRDAETVQRTPVVRAGSEHVVRRQGRTGERHMNEWPLRAVPMQPSEPLDDLAQRRLW